jgi:hypothetical protein
MGVGPITRSAEIRFISDRRLSDRQQYPVLFMRAIRCNDLYHNVGDAICIRCALSITACTMTLSMARPPLMEIYVTSQGYSMSELVTSFYLFSLYSDRSQGWFPSHDGATLFLGEATGRILVNFIRTSPRRPYGCFVRTITC